MFEKLVLKLFKISSGNITSTQIIYDNNIYSGFFVIISKKLIIVNFFPATAAYYLTDVYSEDEARLTDPSPVMSLFRKEGRRPAVYLRFK